MLNIACCDMKQGRRRTRNLCALCASKRRCFFNIKSSLHDENSRFSLNETSFFEVGITRVMVLYSPRERMGSNHPNSFTQADTMLVEGLDLQLSSLCIPTSSL